MYRRFQDLRERGSETDLRKFVRNSTAEELVDILRDCFCKPDAASILDDLLQACSDSEACQLKRRKLTEFSLKTLEKAKISTAQANEIVNRITFDLPRYSTQHLVKFVELCLANISQDDNTFHGWKDLLPVLLETLENEKYVVYADGEVPGTEYKSQVIKAICVCRWSMDLLPSLTKMFGEMSLDKGDRDLVLKTLRSALPNLPLDQVPSFVYQALKLCKDRDNHKLLDTLSKYFDYYYTQVATNNDKDNTESIDAFNIKEVQDTESTVLYHVYQAAQLNHETMKDFIRFLKQVLHASEYILQPFLLAVLMTVSGIYEDQIFDMLRTAITNSSFEQEKRQSSAWSRLLLPPSPNIIDIIRKVIDSSNKDRHLVLKGLTNLAFMLMSADQKLRSNAIAMRCIGLEVIREVTKKRHETVPIVLEELVNKIVSETVPTSHYTDCLKYVCDELSIIVLDHPIWIMTLLERLLFLSTAAAEQVLYAILPLTHVSPNIRENVLLTLRKALYRKGTAKRQVAVTGFLEMLKYSKMQPLSSFRLSQRCNTSSYGNGCSSGSSLTQVTLEYHSQAKERPVAECDKTLCLEILDILRKCFTYELEVRLHLYQGLYDTVLDNPDIIEILLDMLISHFDVYFHADETTIPPVMFEHCVETCGVDVNSMEPIGQLIFLLQKIQIYAGGKSSKTLDRLRGVLESLCERMKAMNLEHLNLESGADLCLTDFPKSAIKIKNLEMSIAIYEALLAFQIGKCSIEDQESVREIEDLFKAYMRMTDFIKTHSVRAKKLDGGKAKKDKDVNNVSKKFGKSLNVKMPSTIMDLDIVRQSLLLIYGNLPALSQSVCSLRNNRSFCRYILQTCEQLLQRTKSFVSDFSHYRSKQYVKLYTEIGRLICQHFLFNLKDATALNMEITIIALRCFKEISCCMCTLPQSELRRFLKAILPENTASADLNIQLQEMIYSLTPYLTSTLCEAAESDEGKEVPLLLLQIVEQFMRKINFETYDHEKMFECMKSMIQMEDVQSSVIPGIVEFFLQLEERTHQYGETLNELSLQLCQTAGSIDETESMASGEYKIIRDDNVLQIYSMLNSQIKEKLNNASWLLMRLKAEDVIARASEKIDETVENKDLREKERNLCKQLSQLAQVLITLSNTSVNSGPCTDITFKNLQSLYHLMGTVTKYFYAKSSSTHAAFQAVKFIQVVQLAGKPLKTAFYNLVTHVEENQNKSDPKSDKFARRKKILRETKVIPRVVYEIEQFSKEVLLLGKRTGIPLENYMKHSVTRDFRIKHPELVEGLEKLDASMLTATNVEDTDNESSNVNLSELENNRDDDAPVLGSSRKRPRLDE